MHFDEHSFVLFTSLKRIAGEEDLVTSLLETLNYECLPRLRDLHFWGAYYETPVLPSGLTNLSISIKLGVVPRWIWFNDLSIRQDVIVLAVYGKPSRFTGRCRVDVEPVSLAHRDRDYIVGAPL